MRTFAGCVQASRLLLAVGISALCAAAWAVDSERTVKAPPAPDYGSAHIKRINEEIRRVWADHQMNPSPQATDGEWCRRVYLDVLGRVPSVDELRSFLTTRGNDRRAKLVDKLLNDDVGGKDHEPYTVAYARNWSTIWTNILIGRNGGLERRSRINREGMQKYLRDSFFRNKSYDRMVYDLVTATGNTTPGEEGFNGATNFLVMKLDENAAQATAMTAKIFLGLQIQCTQCHNHPFNEWKQQKFWEFNAFFRQTQATAKQSKERRNEIESALLLNRDFRGENNDPAEAILFYEMRNGLLQSAFPAFVDGTEIGRSGVVSQCDRRTELGKLITASPFMDKALVNRMWHHFLGYAFTKPYDDLGPHNTPSHPALLDYLGEEFRKNSFNIKDLIRWIVLSEPYALSSKVMSHNKADDPLLGETPKFTHFYLRQMRVEELYESLLVATEAHKTITDEEARARLKSDWLQQFVIAFGNDEGDEATIFNGTIPQALMMFNGDLIKKAISIETGSFLQQVAASNLKPADKIQYLFESGLARRPTPSEINQANTLLLAHKGDQAKALQDFFWAVLNSNEFILQH